LIFVVYVLEEEENLKIITDDNKPVNILIEGDNYHVLSVLNYTHNGKIDVIYIDPPHNTGASDWKYDNNNVDGGPVQTYKFKSLKSRLSTVTYYPLST
jgi:16S rRNA G966 N2-methylase RsmD